MTDDPTAQDPGSEEPAVGSLGEGLAERQRPLRARRPAMTALGALGLPGALGRRSASFAGTSGVSLSTRRALGLAVPDMSVDGLPVAPPAEWDESFLPPVLPRTGDATLDRIIAQQSALANPRPTAPPRGLRSAIGRRHTPTGRDTAPGASARRLRSQSAPVPLQPELRHAVSGVGGGGESRPRAPRSGPAPSPTRPTPSGGRGPRPGRPARGRSGRTAPWQQDPSARSVTTGSVAGTLFTPSLTVALADLPVGPVTAPIPTGPVAPGAPAAPAAPISPASPTSPDRSERVAELARTALGSSPTPVGAMSLPRRTAGLPPGLVGPRSDSAPGGASRVAGATDRIALRVAASSPGSLPVAGPALVGPGAAATTAGDSRTGERGAAAPAASAGRLPRQSTPAPSRTASSRTAPSGTASSVPVASGAMSSGAMSPGPEPVAAATPWSPGGASAGPGAEPALVSSLRAAPPHLSLATLPSRSFGHPAADRRVTVPDLSVSPVGAAAAVAAAPGVAPGLAPAVGSPRPAGSPGRPSSPTRARRGLGTVAALGASPGTSPGGSSSSPVVADRRVAVPSAHGPHAGSSDRPSTPTRRAARSLPDLASPVPSVSLPPPLTATPSPSGPTGAPVTSPIASPISSPGVVSQPVAPPPLGSDPAELFRETLQAQGGPRSRSLPQRFAPMARAIVARPDKVRVSSDEPSRRALAAVGKVAATAGDVVHLARPLDGTPRSAEILAHELTHVANPSPLVRFFDDDRRSREEDRARQVGEIMSKAPVGTPPASPPSAPAPPPPPPPPAPTPSANGGGGTNGPAADVSAVTAPSSGAGRLAPTAETGSRPSDGLDTEDGDRSGPTGSRPEVAPIDIDRLLDALEARVLRELERRGRRWPRPI